MTKKTVVILLGIIFVLTASLAWADHVDNEIQSQQALIDRGTASGTLHSWDAGRAQHTLDKIRHDVDRYREKGKYTERVAEKFMVKLHKNKTRLQQVK